MACDVKSIETLLAADDLPALSERDALMALAGIYGAAVSVTAAAALALAYQTNLQSLSDRQLDEALLSVIC